MKLFNFIFAFLIATLFFVKPVHAEEASGQLTVRGTAGPSQLFSQVKAYRCDISIKSCGDAIYFSLNQAQELPAGKYMMGFENSIYPGWVEIKAGQLTALDLVRIQVSSSLKNATSVKVYRDLTGAFEQSKEFFVQFNLGRHFFRQGSYEFGDLYLTSQLQNDVTQRLTYGSCRQLKNYPEVSAEAREICSQIELATNQNDLSVLFQFQSNSTVIQNWVTAPGDRIKVLLKKQLVSAPVKGTDFVSVFPGQYRMIVDGVKMNSVTIDAGPLVENY